MRWTQPNLKRNFAVASWATLNIWGNMGCVITGVAHGLSSSALFIFSIIPAKLTLGGL